MFLWVWEWSQKLAPNHRNSHASKNSDAAFTFLFKRGGAEPISFSEPPESGFYLSINRAGDEVQE